MRGRGRDGEPFGRGLSSTSNFPLSPSFPLFFSVFLFLSLHILLFLSSASTIFPPPLTFFPFSTSRSRTSSHPAAFPVATFVFARWNALDFWRKPRERGMITRGSGDGRVYASWSWRCVMKRCFVTSVANGGATFARRLPLEWKVVFFPRRAPFVNVLTFVYLKIHTIQLFRFINAERGMKY